MRRKLVAIGNSWGIRLPRALVEQCGADAEVDVRVLGGCLIVAPMKKKPRAGWEESFRKAQSEGGDELLDEPEAHTETEWDRTEWTW